MPLTTTVCRMNLPQKETNDILNRMINNDHVPVAQKLLFAGDPKMKALAQQRYSVPSHLAELNSRIDDIENAIGQTNDGPIGRAFAIRAEKSCDKDSDASVGHLYPKKDKQTA